jgi:molecular chaperone DnaK
MTAFGIDFGTTNSAAVKLMAGGAVQRYGDETGGPLPSLVAIDRATGEMKAGRDVWARRQSLIESQEFYLVQSVKLKLGKDEGYQTEARYITPEDVASFIFKCLSERAQALGSEPIQTATVTIPFDFSPKARMSLRRAAMAAGIEISTFVTESTAALMRYIPDLKHCRNMAVFDWGGGTLDISILRIQDDCLIELATAGMDLAGDDIDRELAYSAHRLVMEKRGQSETFQSMPARSRDSMLTQCESAKRRFEKNEEADITLTSYGGAPAILPSLNRKWMESIVATHVDLAIDLLARTIVKAGLSFDSVQRILVIGGSAKLRLLHERLRNDERFEASVLFAEDAEWDVATGAALVQASAGGYELSESVGLVLSDNSYHEILHPGHRVNGAPKKIAVSLIEDSPQANIIMARRSSPHSRAEGILEFGVPTLGFDLEPVVLRYGITPDLVLSIEAESRNIGLKSKTMREFGQLKFAYRL